MNRRRTAGTLMLIAGPQYLVVEVVVARAWTDPPYDWVDDLVPDLGASGCGPIRGHLVCSPLHGLMNAGFVAQGVLFGLAVILWARAAPARPRATLTVLAVAHTVGLGLLGLFPRSPDGPVTALIPNYVGSGLAVLAPTAVVVLAGRHWRPLGLPRPYGRASVVLGLLVLAAGIGLAVTPVLPLGLTERLSIEPIMVWQVVTGAVLAVRTRERQRRASRRVPVGAAVMP